MIKPRKKYKPKPVNPLAYLVAIQGSSLLTLDDRLRWAMQIDDSIMAISQARADVTHWDTVFNAVNLVEQLVMDGFAQDPDRLVEAAQQACLAIIDRRTNLGIRSARAQELADLRALAEAWSDLMAGITHQQRDDAEIRLNRRICAALKDPNSTARVISPAEVQ